MLPSRTPTVHPATTTATTRTTQATQAVLLAAGVGRRLRPLTDDRPKCLVPVGGVPIVDRLVAQLRSSGIRRFVIATGYRAERLRRHLLEGWAEADLELRFVDNPDHATTNNLVTLWRCRDAVDADPVVVETDLVLVPGAVARVVSAGSAALISPYTDQMDGTSVAVGPTRDITQMYVGGEGSPQRGGFKTVNLTRFTHDDWTGTIVPGLEAGRARGDHHRYYEHVIALALAAGRLAMQGVVIAPDAWAEVDTPDDLARAEAFVAKRPRATPMPTGIAAPRPATRERSADDARPGIVAASGRAAAS